MQKLYKVDNKKEEERTIRLAQTLTVPKNTCSYRTKPITIIVLVNKNSSGDEIANVNFLRRYGTYVLQNTEKENLLRLTN